MDINFGPRGILQINDAIIVFRNFSGAPSKFNREGDRNFAIVIENEETANVLMDAGWNIKIKPPREDGDEPFMFLPVKIKFNDRGPTIYLKSGDADPVRLDEDTIDCLDNIDIAAVDIDLRPYNWEVNGKTGCTAYLQSIYVVQEVDRFAARYN